jgi:hypothetical protein
MNKVNKKFTEVSIKGEANSFFYKMMHYLGIIFVLGLIVTALYFIVPEFFKYSMDYIVNVVKEDYPNLK